MPLYNLEIKDFPGSKIKDELKHEKDYDIFKNCNVLIWCIDIKEESEFQNSIELLLKTLENAFHVNMSIQLEIFITKFDKANYRALENLSLCEREIIDKITIKIEENPFLRRKFDPKQIPFHNLSI